MGSPGCGEEPIGWGEEPTEGCGEDQGEPLKSGALGGREGEGYCLLWMKRIDNMFFDLLKGSREGKALSQSQKQVKTCGGGSCCVGETCGGGKLHDGGERRARRAGRKCVGKRPEGRGDEKTGF